MLIMSKDGSGVAGTLMQVGLTLVPQAWFFSMHRALCCSMSFCGQK